MFWIAIVLFALSAAFMIYAKLIVSRNNQRKFKLILPLNILAFLSGLAGIYALYLFLDSGGHF